MVLWVFGYGSLVWKTGFTYDERVIGYIKGYRRVFYQGNTDHRGTPENPGRCVTLLPKEDCLCWGAAYRVSGEDTEQLVLSYLNLREKEYDVRAYIDFYTMESGTEPALTGVLVFIGSHDKSMNKYYLGPAPLEDMANQIARAVGPSGPNYEYLFRLEEALSEIGCAEDELIELANEVRKLLGGPNEVRKLLGGINAMNGMMNGMNGMNGMMNGMNRITGIKDTVCTKRTLQVNGKVVKEALATH